jgi:hypothetical protein
VTTNLTSVSLVLNHPNPIAIDQSVALLEDGGATNVVLQGSGLIGHSLTYSIVNLPTNGTLTGTAPNLAYTPATNYFGLDAFTFRVTDSVSGLAATGLVSMAMLAVNDAPVVVNPFPNQQGIFGNPYSSNVSGVFLSPDKDVLVYSATGMPPGLLLNATGQISGAPTAVGNFEVRLIARDTEEPIVFATNTFNFFIAKSNAPVTLQNLNQVYNGSARIVTATTVPSGLSVGVTYNGISSAPTNAGVYQVVGTINAVNYVGAATNTLTVTKSNAVLSLLNLNQMFDGTPRVVSLITVPSGLDVQVMYDGNVNAPVAVGSYEVIGTITEANYAGGTTNTLRVADGPLVIQTVTVTDDMNVAVTWQAVSNFTYQLQYKDSLGIAEWQALPSVTATSNTITATNLASGSPRRFYRVLLVP